MPDFFSLFSKWWKLILGFSLGAALVALLVCLISPKEYLSTATALPSNSHVADRSRIFNENIVGLYPEIGTADELDKMEGTAALDTLYIAVANEFNLPAHYQIEPSGEALYKSALKLKKNSHIARSGFGELKIKVWDKDRELAAAIANSLLHKMQQLHQQLRNANNKAILDRLKETFRLNMMGNSGKDSADQATGVKEARTTATDEQLRQYQKLIAEYELALQSNPQVLLTVEPARAALYPDKPRTTATVLFAFAAAFLFAFLLAIYFENRKPLP